MSDRQYVIFKLGDEKYGVEISNVGGITEFSSITKVPDAPAYIEGIINLRGDIIPIINLKTRFNIASTAENADPRIIVYNTNERDIGFVVDDASQVIRLEGKDIDPAPAIIAGKDRQFIAGVGKNDGEIIVLLDFEKILSEEETEMLDEMDLEKVQ
ncbi:chemotaxis protein CheW [Fusibacter sp. JL216-2]|uniref:chemotaxis protein CheW n=1 Tax=Fusibacter sp. JL216-2 TaxID=3071453 RepID=UPI003D349FBB